MIGSTTRTTPRSSTRTASRVAAALGAAALTVALAACGASSDEQPTGSMIPSVSPSASTSAPPPASAATGEHNGADITFTQQMIIHHQGAIAMADLAADRAGDQRVKDLASRIRAAQTPEIREMTGWLRAWGEPAPEPPSGSSTGTMGDMERSMGSMDNGEVEGGAMGMMTEQQMDQLSAASGTAFDRMFLQMMVVHHQGAIAMARHEQTAGASSQARALASSIAASQTAEVSEMQQLLTDLG